MKESGKRIHCTWLPGVVLFLFRLFVCLLDRFQLLCSNKTKNKTKKKFRITAVRGWNDDCYQFSLWKIGDWFETVFSVGFQFGLHTKQLLHWTLWKRFVSSRYACETTVPVKVPWMGCSKTVQCLNCKIAFAVWTISPQETGSRVNFRYHRLRLRDLQRGSSVRCLFYIVCVTTAATAATLALCEWEVGGDDNSPVSCWWGRR